MRYELTPREPDKYICFVGYDKANRTFYVYIANRGATDRNLKMVKNNHVVAWFGTNERELTDVAEVKSLVENYAELPAEIERALRACVEDEKAVEQYIEAGK